MVVNLLIRWSQVRTDPALAPRLPAGNKDATRAAGDPRHPGRQGPGYGAPMTAQRRPLTGERTVPGIPQEHYWFLGTQAMC